MGENVSFIFDFAATLFDRVIGILWFAFWCGFVVLILWCVTMLCVGQHQKFQSSTFGGFLILWWPNVIELWLDMENMKFLCFRGWTLVFDIVVIVCCFWNFIWFV